RGSERAPGAPGAAPPALAPAEAMLRTLGQELALVPDADVARLLAALEVHLERGAPAGGKNLLGGPGGVVGFLLRAWLRVVRAADRFRRLGGDDSTAPDAKRYLPPGLGALVAGHTHGPRLPTRAAPTHIYCGRFG